MGNFTKDDDELFDFDEKLESGTALAGTQSPPEDFDDEERDSFDTESPIRPLEMSSSNKYGYATSPARAIMRPTPVDTESGPVLGAVGSYKGQPFTLRLHHTGRSARSSVASMVEVVWMRATFRVSALVLAVSLVRRRA